MRGASSRVVTIKLTATLGLVGQASTSVLAVAVLLACDIARPSESRVVGFVDPLGMSRPPIVLPDTADASEPFVATVWTTGGGCTREGDTEVVMSTDTVHITPFDIVSHADACRAVEQYFAHQVDLEPAGLGRVLVIIRARNIRGGEAIELEREVWVR